MSENLELPPVQMPTVTRVFSKKFGLQRIGDPEEFIEPVLWEVNEFHPLIPPDKNGNMVRIVRMFRIEGAVEIYSLMPGGARGIRDTIPMSEIRMIQEMMPAEVFIEELTAAEYGEPEDPDLEDLEDPEDEDEDDEGEDKPVQRLQAVSNEPTPSGGGQEPS